MHLSNIADDTAATVAILAALRRIGEEENGIKIEIELEIEELRAIIGALQQRVRVDLLQTIGRDAESGRTGISLEH